MTAMPGLFPLDGFGDAAAAARSEWRADEEAWTSAAVERWVHERSMLDVVRECMHRGDTVSVGFTQRVFSGRVRAVGVDLFALELLEGRVDVAATQRARFVLRVEARARSGGTRGDDVTTMRARLLELEAARCNVEVGVDAGDVVRGQLRIGRDHVLVGSPASHDTVVPIGALSWVLEGSLSRM
jgi:hypothetical protein